MSHGVRLRASGAAAESSRARLAGFRVRESREILSGVHRFTNEVVSSASAGPLSTSVSLSSPRCISFVSRTVSRLDPSVLTGE